MNQCCIVLVSYNVSGVRSIVSSSLIAEQLLYFSSIQT